MSQPPMDAMAMPVLIAWAAAQVTEFEGITPSIWWGFPFELIEGASGFSAHQRRHGFCGFAVEDFSMVGGAGTDENLPAVISAQGTTPEQLRPYVNEIRAAYLAHMRELGLSAAES